MLLRNCVSIIIVVDIIIYYNTSIIGIMCSVGKKTFLKDQLCMKTNLQLKLNKYTKHDISILKIRCGRNEI